MKKLKSLFRHISETDASIWGYATLNVLPR